MSHSVAKKKNSQWHSVEEIFVLSSFVVCFVLTLFVAVPVVQFSARRQLN